MPNRTKDRYNDGWANGYRKTPRQTSWETVLIVLVGAVFMAAFIILR